MLLNEKRQKNSWLPEDLINDIAAIGKILKISAKCENPIDWLKADFYQSYFKWVILFQSKESLAKVDDIFLFFKENNSIEIEELTEESVSLLGEIFVTEGKINKEDLDAALEKNKIGKALVRDKKVTDSDVEEALKAQEKIRKDMHLGNELKISTKKVDDLIDLVGELIITNSNLNSFQNQSDGNDLDMEQVQYSINKISKQMRDIILSLKMVPIGQLLVKYHRMVRDLSRDFKKEIDFLLEGEGTELDKSMFDVLQEPLLHIIRNSVDHGIESPEEREKLGKPREGKILIRAYQESGQITIEIEDDGKGLDVEKIRAKAIQKGLLKEGNDYSEEEVFDVIFESGFSTKEKATLVSGRGVGMDAVKAGIKQINGSVRVNSKAGIGTTFIIQLPLTLAIIEGFLLRVGLNHFVTPLTSISECFEVNYAELLGNKMVHNLRGEYLTVVALSETFENIKHDDVDAVTRQVVVLEFSEQKIGIMVDEVIGNIQAVIKPLAKIVNKSNVLAGSTILGTGEVGLIIDVANLVRKFKIE